MSDVKSTGMRPADLLALPMAERHELLGGMRRRVPGMAGTARATVMEMAAIAGEPWKTITVQTAFDLLLSNGLKVHFAVGTYDVPESLTEHWYLRVHAHPGAVDLAAEKPEYEFPATGLYHPDRPKDDDEGPVSGKGDDDADKVGLDKVTTAGKPPVPPVAGATGAPGPEKPAATGPDKPPAS